MKTFIAVQTRDLETFFDFILKEMSDVQLRLLAAEASDQHTVFSQRQLVDISTNRQIPAQNRLTFLRILLGRINNRLGTSEG